MPAETLSYLKTEISQTHHVPRSCHVAAAAHVQSSNWERSKQCREMQYEREQVKMED